MSQESLHAAEEKYTAWAVSALVFLVASLAFVYSFFMDRQVVFDEIGLYNPIYMFLHYGKMTYPAHGHFDDMVIHPPIHYLEVAILMKLGLSLFQAAGVPMFLLTLLSLFLIFRGPFAVIVKIGLVFGMYTAVFVWGAVDTVRPDLNLALAWFAGLIGLESARLENWNLRKLSLGSFLLTYASGTHYVGASAFLGIVVYAIWVYRTLGFSRARSSLVAMLVGGCLFGIPYLLFFVVPNWAGIWAIGTAVQGAGGPFDAFRMSISAYRDWSLHLFGNWGLRPIVSMVTFPLLRIGIPAAFIAPLLLALFSTTRGIAVAGLPQLLFIWFYLRDPLKTQYTGFYVPEFMLYLSGIAIVIFAGINYLFRRHLPKHYHAGILPGVVLLAMIGTMINIPMTLGNRLSLTPRLADLDIARAAGREIVGPDALVGTSSAGVWYIAGATHLYFITSDLLYPADISHVDVASYFASFDAMAQDTLGSGLTWNDRRATLTSWYVDGTLNLKGFYFGRKSSPSYLLFATKRATPMLGYAFRGDRLYRFEERSGGDVVFVAAVCPANVSLSGVFRADPFNTLFLPGLKRGTNGDRVIRTFVVDRRKHGDDRVLIAKRCELRDRILGYLREVHMQPLLAKLRQTDQPIRFYRTFSEAVARIKRMIVPTLPQRSLRISGTPTALSLS